ncbi:hypothetical protein FBZ89_12355 [Nitrospirillum amazonense]|uniref:Uncharacterized protein n=1 Tax=Nitrospirillum amazonense TaxID=28077 RepID=A0A560ETZ0_9PROT|nr:hypothetical protein [Nitrospirillum amazonense]TWB12842.1 hypothetical protein FBZ89_12355 [Nitrospirillum amazonense]
MVLAKTQRFQLFLERLAVAPPAADADGALALLSAVLNGVEDEHAGVPHDPANWQADGRMYPPQADAARLVPGRDGWRRYRNRGHNTLVGVDGAIEIVRLDGTCLLRKPGAPSEGKGS